MRKLRYRMIRRVSYAKSSKPLLIVALIYNDEVIEA